MIYLLDANVLIDANRDYYAIDRVPEFWAWLVYQGIIDAVKIPIEIYEEIKDGDDALALWAKDNATEDALLLNEAADPTVVATITNEGYAADLKDDEIEKVGRDPFLISYAMIDPNDRTVVTTEVSRPTRQRANRHIPDVCGTFELRCRNTFEFVRELNFSTNWQQN
ncbi:conserved protein of unknown function [uncultured Woeseiaceae bacterium]|uniref:Uncharacterized protein n=1 Tax=uncultured Woeseiaceae bacterium TaxID=1983305 RepID=A0A7D9H3A9_9GAMM|nr:conserved protein of unknown function [uncultured Woeseiaceae bacterium]